MIDRIGGVLIFKSPPRLVVENNNIGYEIFTSMNSFYKLPEINNFIIIFTHLLIREHDQILYGFIDIGERNFFRKLIQISGIGPKIALAILSNLKPAKLMLSINENRIENLIAIPGVGRKTAQRLVLEMRDKFKKDYSQNSTKQNLNNQKEQNNIVDAHRALVVLGYKSQVAKLAIERVCTNENQNNSSFACEDLIRLALKELQNSKR